MAKEVTICGCVSRHFMDREKVARMAALLKRHGYEVRVVDDLCRIAEDKEAPAGHLAGRLVVACHERAVRSMLGWTGTEAADVLNLRTEAVEALAARIGIADTATDEAQVQEFREQLAACPSEAGHDAWFPVIDRDRCVDCGKCHDFCLFGVYTLDEDGKVQVTNPHNCKNNCPACARTCPQEAVIFPKHDFAPINGGEAKEEAAFKIDTKQMYNQALRERLAARRAGVSLLRQNNWKK